LLKAASCGLFAVRDRAGCINSGEYKSRVRVYSGEPMDSRCVHCKQCGFPDRSIEHQELE
jgi:hypothetical protein